MRYTIAIVAVTLAAALTSCGGDRIVGRFEEGICNNKDMRGKCSDSSFEPRATVSLASAATPAPPGGAACGGFAERAAAECVKALAQKTGNDPDQFIRALSQPLETPDDSINRTRFNRTLALTISKTKFNPTDRIEMVDATIKPIDGTFATWIVAESKYKTINLGTVEVSEKRNAEINLSGEAPATALFPLSGSAKVSGESSRSENFEAKMQVEQLTVNILPQADGTQALRVFQQGGIGNDLTGTVLVKAVLTTGSAATPAVKRVFKIGPYANSSGQATQPKALSVDEVANVEAAWAKKAITAKVTATYTIRHVRSGDQTAEERDDKAEYTTYKDEDQGTFALVPKSQMNLDLYAITAGPMNDKLRIDSPTSKEPAVLCFDSINNAAAFVRYMRLLGAAVPTPIGGYQIGFSNGGTMVPLTTNPGASAQVVEGC